MPGIRSNGKRQPAWCGLWSAGLLLMLLSIAPAGAAEAVDANLSGDASGGALRARHSTLQDRLNNNPFQRPLALDSSETSSGVAGNIHALVNHPFATVAAALKNPAQWCDILSLHLNTKYCRATAGDALNVTIGKKFDQPLDEAYPITFAWRVNSQTADYLQVRLNAGEGPLNTSNYRILLEAVPMGSGQTFIHLSYSYSYGLVGRLAMQTYLGTVGRDKVGFTISGSGADGMPRHVGGMRGVVERNTMRYYLAIEAHLGALTQPLQARLEKRLHDWFAATERYPRQLHEMERGEYLDMKRREYLRQQRGVQAVLPG